MWLVRTYPKSERCTHQVIWNSPLHKKHGDSYELNSEGYMLFVRNRSRQYQFLRSPALPCRMDVYFLFLIHYNAFSSPSSDQSSGPFSVLSTEKRATWLLIQYSTFPYYRVRNQATVCVWSALIGNISLLYFNSCSYPLLFTSTFSPKTCSNLSFPSHSFSNYFLVFSFYQHSAIAVNFTIIPEVPSTGTYLSFSLTCSTPQKFWNRFALNSSNIEEFFLGMLWHSVSTQRRLPKLGAIR